MVWRDVRPQAGLAQLGGDNRVGLLAATRATSRRRWQSPALAIGGRNSTNLQQAPSR